MSWNGEQVLRSKKLYELYELYELYGAVVVCHTFRTWTPFDARGN